MVAEHPTNPNPQTAADWIRYMANPHPRPQHGTFPPLERIVLLEDVVGSGSQCLKAVRWAVTALGKPVLFIPLILCPNGVEALRNLEKQMSGRLSVRPVIELRRTDLLGPERQSHRGWPIADKVEDLAVRYASRASANMATFGFQNTGCSLECFLTLRITRCLSFTTSPIPEIGNLFFQECIETDMNITVNPFQQLYFSDDTQTDTTFAELFSAEVLQAAINPVFQGGNVVLSGAQGCGKTMILTLLRPQTRIAYSKLGLPFPVDKQMRNFVSAGVNLTRSRITDIVQVTLHSGEETDERELPHYFADFFNYWVVEDLIKSIEIIGQNPNIFDSIVDLAYIKKFIGVLTKQDCWFGALEGVVNLEQLRMRIAGRVNEYRRWVNGNLPDDRLPDTISKSKTNIGEPIAQTAECLRRSGVIKEEVPVLIRVDQVEEMHRAFNDRQRRLLLSFRKMLNRVFAARDARIHYRIGTRRYGWRNPEFLGIWGARRVWRTDVTTN